MLRKIKTILCLLLILTLPVLAAGEKAEPKQTMLLHQLNIGCAAGYLIETEDTVILVDCGVNSQAKSAKNPTLFEYLEASGIEKVDLYFVTHWHTDHAFFVDEIMELYGEEDTVVYGPSAELPERFLPLPAGSYRQLTDGTELEVGPFRILCLGPEDPGVTGEQNADSLNFLLTYGEKKFIFTGDFVQNNIVKRHPEEILDVDLLCFPHHGLQPYAISRIALGKMDPDYIFIPANTQGNLRVYCNDCDVTCSIYCGGRNGNVVAVCDGTEIAIETDVLPGQFAGYFTEQ